MADRREIEALFSRLKGAPSEQDHSAPPSLWAQPPTSQTGYQPPSVSSPLFSPPILTPNPVHSSSVLSPAGRDSPFAAPGPATSDQNRANHLLNLLKFNGAQSPVPGPMAGLQNVQAADAPQRASSLRVLQSNRQGNGQEAGQARPLSASDLVASLSRQAPTSSAEKQPFESTANKANTQDFLLNLLTKPSKNASAAGAGDQKPSEPSINALAQSLAESVITPGEQPSASIASPSVESATIVAPQPAKQGLFNYVNPFDQLHASSPLNRTPAPAEKKIEILKHDREVSDSVNGTSGAPPAKTRKIALPEHESVKQELEASTVSKDQQSVSEKLEKLSGKVQNEAEEALAAAGGNKPAAVSKPKKKAEPVVPIVTKQAVDDTVDTDWSTAEDEDTKQEEEAKVEVFNFPMKPFVTLQLTSARAARQFRASTWESATPIARLKKDFSHDDRLLATASQHHIIYTVVPTEKKPDAGLKIIRQDDGKNKHVWAKAGERLCNVQVSSFSQGDVESVLATGVNGTIFFTTLAKSRGDLFDDDDVEAHGFTMSPPPNSDEPSSTSSFGTSSAIKTRAKLSNRHSAQYFAVARGRQIHLIAPEVVRAPAYTDPKNHVVNTEKYLAENSLSINTAKAGKDFCFSEDDSTLISLDKVGKVKFWDIRSLTSSIEQYTQGSLDKPRNNELKDPIHTFATATSPLNPDDKMSPSSITLLDKDRPCAKGVALRYLLIGYQQNHILQLWDLGLGKCVQEIRFPESAGSSNAMCSVNYHPKTGIICVSHPGRNSIYLIHLSAPRYNLPAMPQAEFVSALARQDAKLPRPESTAIMSGMREYSLGKVGDLRSVDMLKTPFPNLDAPDDATSETLFELYVLHSKGVVGLLIKRDDLGWDSKGKMVKPVNAEAEGVVKVSELVTKPASVAESATASQPDVAQKPVTKTPKKEKAETPKTTVKKETPPVASNGAAPPTPAKQSMQIPEAPAATNPPIITPESYALAAQHPKSPVREREVELTAPVPAPALVQKTTETKPKAEKSSPASAVATPAPSEPVGSNVAEMLTKQFAALYQKLDQDKRVAEAAGAAKQDAILRLVSSTLTENVENSLNQIVSASIENKVLPALAASTTSLIERKLNETLNKQVGVAIAKEVSAAVPGAVSLALKDASVARAMSAHIVDEVTKQVKMDMGGLVQRSMQTVQTNMASQMTQSTQATQRAVADLEAKFANQAREAAAQQKQQNDVIAQLTSSVHDLASVVQSMKEEHGKLLREATQQSSTDSQTPHTPATAEEDKSLETPEQAELTRLTQLLRDGEYQRATIDWLQSSRQAELFDDLFIYLNPLYLQQVSSLVALSVSAAITASFETNVNKRLEWLGTIVSNIDHNDADIRDVAPKIMDVLYQRLQGAYMQLAESQPRNEGALRKMVTLTRQIGEVKRELA